MAEEEESNNEVLFIVLGVLITILFIGAAVLVYVAIRKKWSRCCKKEEPENNMHLGPITAQVEKDKQAVTFGIDKKFTEGVADMYNKIEDGINGAVHKTEEYFYSVPTVREHAK